MAFFIAEVSSNHSKDIKRALEFVDVADGLRPLKSIRNTQPDN